MVVHRGSPSWESLPERSSLVAVSESNLVSFEQSSPAFKHNSVQTFADSEQGENLVVWKNTFNMRQVILNNLPNGQAGFRVASRHLQPAHSRLRGRSLTNATKSLDILRQNLQATINKEIDGVLKKYLEKFFKPAVENIRGNLGAGSVTEEHVREVCRTILDEAKLIYSVTSLSRGSSPFSDSETGSLIDCRFGRNNSNSPLFRKRKESDTDSDASNSVRRKKMFKDRWDPNRINRDTLFILGQRATKVLGLGHMRGRLFVKHPELFKYLGDQDDRDWLINQKVSVLPVSQGNPYIMLFDDIKELTQSDEYRNSPNLSISELKGFEIPDFMLKKIRSYMDKVRFKSGVNFTEVSESSDIHGNLSLAVDCVSSTMTPPNNALESAPTTPSEALDLMECPSFQAQTSPAPYIKVEVPDLSNTTAMADSHSSLSVDIADSHATLSALLAASTPGSDNSED